MCTTSPGVTLLFHFVGAEVAEVAETVGGFTMIPFLLLSLLSMAAGSESDVINAGSDVINVQLAESELDGTAADDR